MLELFPITLKEAKIFISAHHRHHKPPLNWKFGVCVSDGNKVVGVITVGRPVARLLDDGLTVEITRCCTDGTPNVASKLYGAAARASFALGYKRVITYTSVNEPGTSLKCSNFKVVAEVKGRSWNCPSRSREDKSVIQDRFRWEFNFE